MDASGTSGLLIDNLHAMWLTAAASTQTFGASQEGDLRWQTAKAAVELENAQGATAVAARHLALGNAQNAEAPANARSVTEQAKARRNGMQLVKCWECSGTISSQASRCPHCKTLFPRGNHCAICAKPVRFSESIVRTDIRKIYMHKECVEAVRSESRGLQYTHVRPAEVANPSKLVASKQGTFFAVSVQLVAIRLKDQA